MSFDPDRLAQVLLQDMPDALIVADAAGLIQFWNHGAERLFGFPAEEAQGQSLDLIIPDRLRARHWAGFHETMRTGQSRYGAGEILSVPALRKDGGRLSVEFTILPLRDASGRMEGIAAIMRDATKRFEQIRALQKEVEALKSAQSGS
ncbi:MAG TPA: PAS domain S-box protein [Acetobacteraceae bacterium]|nr:PAS domain S-box protein [Acetobacteraceae bacterium]